MAWWGEYVPHQQFTLYAWWTVVLPLRLSGSNEKRNWSQDVCEVWRGKMEARCGKTSLASVWSKKTQLLELFVAFHSRLTEHGDYFLRFFEDLMKSHHVQMERVRLDDLVWSSVRQTSRCEMLVFILPRGESDELSSSNHRGPPQDESHRLVQWEETSRCHLCWSSGFWFYLRWLHAAKHLRP